MEQVQGDKRDAPGVTRLQRLLKIVKAGATLFVEDDGLDIGNEIVFRQVRVSITARTEVRAPR